MTEPNPPPSPRIRLARVNTLRRLVRRLRGIASPARAGLSLGLGVFIGCLPIYGLHLPLCLLVCVPFRLDALLAYLGANISNPLFAPGLLALELQVGSLVLRQQTLALDLDQIMQQGLTSLVGELAIGSLLVGTFLAGITGAVAFAVSGRQGTNLVLGDAIRKTTLRYRQAPLGDLVYVALKLRFDPVLEEILELGPLGAVVDAGAGRGQLGLALLELGRASSLWGFDWDDRKIQIARSAAGEVARYEIGDLRDATPGVSDTILMIDVLHYLQRSDQDALLARASRSLRPGGRLLVREVDRSGSLGSLATRASERLLAAIGYNRSATPLQFRSTRSIAECLSTLGLECAIEDASRGTPFENRLIVAQLPRRRVSPAAG